MFFPQLLTALAQAKLADTRRVADSRSLLRGTAMDNGRAAAGNSVALRFGAPADEAKLAHLAALDSSTPLVQPVLLAEVDGQIRAALALSDGTVVADPLQRTADLIELLRARARQLGGDGRPTHSYRNRSWSRLFLPRGRARKSS